MSKGPGAPVAGPVLPSTGTDPQPLWCPRRCQQSLGGPRSGGPHRAPLSGTHRLCGRTSPWAGSLACFLLSVNPKPSSVASRPSAEARWLQASCCLPLSPARSWFGFLWAASPGSLCHLPPQPKGGVGALVPQWVVASHQGGPVVLELSPPAGKAPGRGQAQLLSLNPPPGGRACLVPRGCVLGCLGPHGAEAGLSSLCHPLSIWWLWWRLSVHILLC